MAFHHRSRLTVWGVTFDIEGFFNKVRLEDVTATLASLGLPLAFQHWTTSLLSEREIALRFNSSTGPWRRKPNVGVPQGSPLSPLLSTLVASDALHLPPGQNLSLFTYLDDGFMVYKHHRPAETRTALAGGLLLVERRLHRVNMRIDRASVQFFAPAHIPPINNCLDLSINTVIRFSCTQDATSLHIL